MWYITCIASEREQPFTIRAHHIEAGPFGFDSGLFKKKTPTMDEIYDYAYWITMSELRASRSPKPADREYGYDVLGDNPFEHQRRTSLTVLRFKMLPDDHPVLITQEPDEVCKTCVIGNHCRSETMSEHDARYIDQLIGCSEYIGLRRDQDFSVSSAEGKRKVLLAKSVYLKILGSIDEYRESIFAQMPC